MCSSGLQWILKRPSLLQLLLFVGDYGSWTSTPIFGRLPLFLKLLLKQLTEITTADAISGPSWNVKPLSAVQRFLAGPKTGDVFQSPFSTTLHTSKLCQPDCITLADPRLLLPSWCVQCCMSTITTRYSIWFDCHESGFIFLNIKWKRKCIPSSCMTQEKTAQEMYFWIHKKLQKVSQ